MKLVFLGTAAAEGIPGLWCGCAICREARKRGGKDIRRRCSYLIDDDTMIDFGPDSFDHMRRAEIDLARLKRVAFTHPHGDHMSPIEFLYRRSPSFCTDVPEYKLDVLGTKMTLRQLVRGILSSNSPSLDAVNLFEYLRLNPITVKEGEWANSGDVEFLPVTASHAAGLGAVIYAIRRNGKNLLVANDTGWLAEEAWRMLDGLRFDTAVIECTTAFRNPDYHTTHQGFNTTLKFRERLVEMRCLEPETPAYVTHFSHNGYGLHEELEERFRPYGMTVAYDGLTIEV
jgi:phosphoribosyl 1,2-cyclic phosphate phosphodiesterase